MGSYSPADFDVKRIAIIGAGPGGLATAKYLRAQDTFEDIVIFEQQDEVAGIWNYNTLAPVICPAPQEDAFGPPDEPVRVGDDAAPVFTNPMYERLHANIPGSLMNFVDQEFPADELVFPARDSIRKYLLRYAEDVRSMVRLCQQVTRVTLQDEQGRDKWQIEARSTRDGSCTKETFDALVVANGHYTTPFVPSVKGMEAFNEAHPGVISHSKQYRTPEAFQGQKVIVVGNGPSGLDIALQVNQECKSPALISVRHPTPPERLAHSGCKEIAEIDEFLVDQKGVRFTDGHVETGVDAIIYCTGFLYTYPFLQDLQHKLITVGKGVHGLYKHFIHVQHPTLAFPGLNMKAAPWPLMEAEAAVLSVVWSNSLQLPPTEEMQAWSQELDKTQGEALHVFGPLGDGHFINELHDWVLTANKLGKKPPYWDDEIMWQRSIFIEAKARFEKLGCKAKTLEELGFHYEPKAPEPL